MTLVRRVLAEKPTACAVVAALVLAALVLYGLAVQPARRGLEQARRDAAQAAAAADAREAELQAARAQLSAVERTAAQLRRFDEHVLPGDLAQARALAYPHLASLAARFGLALERRSSEQESDPAARVGWLRTTLRLAGRYADVRRFVEAIETAPDFLIIDGVFVSQRGTAADGDLLVTLAISTAYPVPAGGRQSGG